MHFADEQLGAFVDGELPRAEAEAVRAHLGECADCRGTVNMLERVNAAVREAEIDPSPEFEARALAKLRALPLPRRPWLRLLGFEGRRFMPAMAAASLFVVIAVGYRNWQPSSDAARLDDVEVAEHADFLEDYELIEELDVIEDIDKVPG